MKNDNYRRWSLKELVNRFAAKTTDDFFLSETHFLNEIAAEVETILDVGCASGNYYAMVKQFNEQIRYHGIDISEENIISARKLHPNCSFELANALEYQPMEKFDLVNATGVVQHESEYEALIASLIGMSKKYTLFDLKISTNGAMCTDIEECFTGNGEYRVPYNIFSIGWLIPFLQGFREIRRISIYGYRTPFNNKTTVPVGMNKAFSAGVLCESNPGEGNEAGPEIDLYLAGAE